MVTFENAMKVVATIGKVTKLKLDKPKKAMFNNYCRFRDVVPMKGKLSPGRFLQVAGKGIVWNFNMRDYHQFA